MEHAWDLSCRLRPNSTQTVPVAECPYGCCVGGVCANSGICAKVNTVAAALLAVIATVLLLLAVLFYFRRRALGRRLVPVPGQPAGAGEPSCVSLRAPRAQGRQGSGDDGAGHVVVMVPIASGAPFQEAGS